jgi:hypothetical protein
MWHMYLMLSQWHIGSFSRLKRQIAAHETLYTTERMITDFSQRSSWPNILSSSSYTDTRTRFLSLDLERALRRLDGIMAIVLSWMRLISLARSSGHDSQVRSTLLILAQLFNKSEETQVPRFRTLRGRHPIKVG